MRQHPIGTGPFKFVEYKPNQSIKVVKNPDYWKKGVPYLDAIEWTIIPNRSTQMLAFVAGQFDMTFPYEHHPVEVRKRDAIRQRLAIGDVQRGAMRGSAISP